MATLVMALPAGAEELTLRDAVELAIVKNLDVQSAREDIQKSKAGDIVAKSALMPSLTIEGSYTRKDGAYALANDKDVYGASIRATQPIYTGGRATALLKQSKAYTESVTANVTATEEDIAYDVVSQFYKVLEQREDVAAAMDSVTLAESHLNEVRKKEALGVSNRFEVTRAEQQLSSYSTQLITSKNQLASSKIVLMTTLRLPPKGDTSIEGELTFRIYSGDRETSLKRALENRADLKSAVANVSVQREEVQVAASGLRPKANINASYMYDDPKKSNGDGDDDWKIELDVEVPLLDRNVTKAQIMKEKATLRQKELAVEKQKDAIKSAVVKSWLDLESAKQAVISTTKSLELAAESLRLSQVGYREGVSTQIDVLDAQSAYATSRKGHASAISAYNISVASLKKTEGELLRYLREETVKQ